MTSTRPAISIIVPAYQVAPLIAETLHSIQGQTLTDWQALIIDDGSTDELVAVVTPFLADRRFQLHRFANAGLAEARNRGIALAEGRYIALLDGDDIYHPDYLRIMSAVLDDQPEIGFVTCDMQLFGDPATEGRRFSTIESQIPPITLQRVLERDFTFAVMCMLRSEVVKATGGFDPTLRAAEDFDLWTRLLIDGVQAAYVPLPLVRYRRRPGSLSNSPEVFRTNIAAVYLRLMARLKGTPEASICRYFTMRQLALLDRWEGEQALRAGRMEEARQKLWRAAKLLPGLRGRLLAVVTLLSPRAGSVLLALLSGRSARPES